MKLYGIIVGLLIVGVGLAGCPAAYSPTDLQSGRIGASTNANSDVSLSQNVNYYNFTLEFPLTGTPQVAIASSYLEGQFGSDQFYAIAALANQASGTSLPFTVSINFPNTYWITIRWTFFATTRFDFQLGQLNGSIQSPNQQQQLLVPLTKNIQNPTVYIFIAGYTVSANAYNSQPAPLFFRVISKQATNNQLNVTVVSNFLGFVSLGYVVFNSISVQAAFTVLDGQTQQTTLNVNQMGMMKKVYTYIVGATEFSNPVKSQMSFEITINNSFILTANSRSGTSLTVSYILVENLQSSMCSLCPNSNIYDGSGCVSNCNGNAMVQMITSNFGVCTECDIENFMVVDRTRSNCICADQCYQIGATACRPCHYTCATCSGPSSNNCTTCDLNPPVFTNRYLLNGNCVCANGYFDDAISGSCLPCHYTCQSCQGSLKTDCRSCNSTVNRNLVGGQCVCISGYVDDGYNPPCQCQSFLPNGTCAGQAPPVPINCPPNSMLSGNGSCECVSGFINSSSGGCVACPNDSQKVNSFQCSCLQGFTNISGSCLKCPANFVIVGNQCQCSSNSVESNGLCVQCPANSAVINGQCSCNAGFILIGQICQPCPPNSNKISASQCVCIQNHVNISGTCTPCTGGQQAVAGVCQCPGNGNLINGQCGTCPTNSNFVNGRCECQPSFQNVSGTCRFCPVGANSQCQCPSNTVLVGNTCTACQANARVVDSRCQCNNGYTNISGTCTLSCQGGSQLVNNICRCPSSTVNRSGVCTPCPSGSITTDGQCRCPPNSYLAGNDCIQCSGNAIFRDGKCQCDIGMVNISGICGMCNANQRYDPQSLSCPCIDGFTKNSSGLCAVGGSSGGSGGGENPATCFPPNYIVRGTCRICTATERVVRGTCICRAGRFYDMNMQCRSPRTGQVGIGGFITCRNGFFNVSGVCSRCSGGKYNPNTQDCQCPPGFEKNQANNCVRSKNTINCGNGYHNGTSCVCNPGSYINNAICVSCPQNMTLNGNSCVCANGYSNISGVCRCPNNANFNGQTCVCNSGFYNISGQCITCPVNTVWSGTTCNCRPQFIPINGVCQCPPNTIQSGDGCACQDTFVNISGSCRCPAGAMQVGNRCTCSQGTLINGTCTTQSPNCQGNATFNGSACNCNPGFFNLRGMCLPNPSNCPPNSVQSANGSCVCNIPGFVVAGNQCQPCPPNSFFNGATCICYMGTYSNITGSCQICFPPSNWNGTSCNCPGGQTYINNQCITCHSSCRTCSGPFANQCLSCSNPSSRLVGGVCSGNCPPSTFFRAETGSCEQCSGRCVNCLSFSQCTQCSLGFQIFNGLCREICGDGRKFDVQCDDGNRINGDGCSSTCAIEQGWNCSGGNSNQRDTCARVSTPSPLRNLNFTPTGASRQRSSFKIFGVLNQVPPEIASNGCPLCQYLVTASTSQTNSNPRVTVSYSPPRNITITYDFNGAEPTLFQTTIDFNQDLMRQLLPGYNAGSSLRYTINPSIYPLGQ